MYILINGQYKKHTPAVCIIFSNFLFNWSTRSCLRSMMRTRLAISCSERMMISFFFCISSNKAFDICRCLITHEKTLLTSNSSVAIAFSASTISASYNKIKGIILNKIMFQKYDRCFLNMLLFLKGVSELMMSEIMRI